MVAHLPRMDSMGTSNLMLDSRDMKDVCVDKLLEEFDDLQRDWDSSANLFSAASKNYSYPPMQDKQTTMVWKKPKAAAKQQVEPAGKKRKVQVTMDDGGLWGGPEQVMQMPGTWFDMPEFAPESAMAPMNVMMNDTMMFDAITDGAVNEGSSTGGYSDAPPAYTQNAVPHPQTATGSLDDNILNFFKTGEFRDIVVNVEKENVATQQQQSTQVVAKAARSSPFTFSFEPPADLEVAANKRAVRLAALARYRQKKIDRINNPTIRYKSRKKIADNRPRVKGRFIKTDETVRAVQPTAEPLV